MRYVKGKKEEIKLLEDKLCELKIELMFFLYGFVVC